MRQRLGEATDSLVFDGNISKKQFKFAKGTTGWRGETGEDAPLTHSVARELEAMAEPQPNVLNLASRTTPSTILSWSFITSPQAGAPTSPVPTSASSSLLNLPTLRGLS